MNMLKTCLNPKVVGALALTAGLVLVFAPNLLVAVLPLLLLAACPLSMLLMSRAMMRGHDQASEGSSPPVDVDSMDEVAPLRAEVTALREQVRQTDPSARANAASSRGQ